MAGPETKTSGARARDPWAVGFGVVAVLVLVVGLLLMYTGVGADLGQERTVLLTVRVSNVHRESLGRVKVGDAAYSEPAGIPIGKVIEVVETPEVEANPDASGTLVASENPVEWRADVTIEATGRRGKDVTAVGSQVVSVGQQFGFYTPTTFVDGIAVRLDVR